MGRRYMLLCGHSVQCTASCCRCWRVTDICAGSVLSSTGFGNCGRVDRYLRRVRSVLSAGRTSEPRHAKAWQSQRLQSSANRSLCEPICERMVASRAEWSWCTNTSISTAPSICAAFTACSNSVTEYPIHTGSHFCCCCVRSVADAASCTSRDATATSESIFGICTAFYNARSICAVCPATAPACARPSTRAALKACTTTAYVGSSISFQSCCRSDAWIRISICGGATCI